jgi:hypothetical protein
MVVGMNTPAIALDPAPLAGHAAASPPRAARQVEIVVPVVRRRPGAHLGLAGRAALDHPAPARTAEVAVLLIASLIATLARFGLYRS